MMVLFDWGRDGMQGFLAFPDRARIEEGLSKLRPSFLELFDGIDVEPLNSPEKAVRCVASHHFMRVSYFRKRLRRL